MKKKWLLIWTLVIAAPIALLVWQNRDSDLGALKSYAMLPNNSVTLLSTAWCGYCTKMRHMFERYDIPYVELDIEKSEKGKALYDAVNGKGIPVVIANDTLINGYNPKAVIRVLNAQVESLGIIAK